MHLVPGMGCFLNHAQRCKMSTSSLQDLVNEREACHFLMYLHVILTQKVPLPCNVVSTSCAHVTETVP